MEDAGVMPKPIDQLAISGEVRSENKTRIK
jgi:hypothetical protein